MGDVRPGTGGGGGVDVAEAGAGGDDIRPKQSMDVERNMHTLMDMQSTYANQPLCCMLHVACCDACTCACVPVVGGDGNGFHGGGEGPGLPAELNRSRMIEVDDMI